MRLQIPTPIATLNGEGSIVILSIIIITRKQKLKDPIGYLVDENVLYQWEACSDLAVCRKLACAMQVPFCKAKALRLY